jgi:hypothetical protein
VRGVSGAGSYVDSDEVPRLGGSSISTSLGICEQEKGLLESAFSGACLDVRLIEGMGGMAEDCLEVSMGLRNATDSGLSQTSLEVFNSPRSMEKSAPLDTEITLASLELEVYEVEEHTPLVCRPAMVFLGKKGSQTAGRALKLVEEFSHYVGILCDGYEGKLSELFADIIANNEEKGAVVASTMGKKGTRELNNLLCSINYEGSACWDSFKGRARKEFL